MATPSRLDIGGVTEAVRLVGIDTPEVGECGTKKRSDALAALRAERDAHVDGRSEDDRATATTCLLRYVKITKRRRPANRVGE